MVGWIKGTKIKHIKLVFFKHLPTFRALQAETFHKVFVAAIQLHSLWLQRNNLLLCLLLHKRTISKFSQVLLHRKMKQNSDTSLMFRERETFSFFSVFFFKPFSFFIGFCFFFVSSRFYFHAAGCCSRTSA